MEGGTRKIVASKEIGKKVQQMSKGIMADNMLTNDKTNRMVPAFIQKTCSGRYKANYRD